ncbi:hypothetical protein AHAS_Ahas09G0148700 [Arachis hypogaea]
MANKYIKHAYRLVENILVNVGKFFLPADFVILDTGEDENAFIILERSFLATRRALIEEEVGELVLRVHNEQLVFHVLKDMHLGGEEKKCMQTELITPNLQEPPDDAQQNLQLNPPFVTINKIPPNIKPKFGVGNALSTKEEVPKKKKVPRGWRNKKIPTEGFSLGIKVVFTACPILPHTVNRILSFEHIELINGSTEKKFTVRSEELSPYDPPP